MVGLVRWTFGMVNIFCRACKTNQHCWIVVPFWCLSPALSYYIPWEAAEDGSNTWVPVCHMGVLESLRWTQTTTCACECKRETNKQKCGKLMPLREGCGLDALKTAQRSISSTSKVPQVTCMLAGKTPNLGSFLRISIPKEARAQNWWGKFSHPTPNSLQPRSIQNQSTPVSAELPT